MANTGVTATELRRPEWLPELDAAGAREIFQQGEEAVVFALLGLARRATEIADKDRAINKCRVHRGTVVTTVNLGGDRRVTYFSLDP